YLHQLIEALGGTVIDYAGAYKCCGFPIITMNKEASLTMAGRNLGDAVDADADCLVTPCPLCHLNLDLQQPLAERLIGRDLGRRAERGERLADGRERGADERGRRADERDSIADEREHQVDEEEEARYPPWPGPAGERIRLSREALRRSRDALDRRQARMGRQQ